MSLGVARYWLRAVLPRRWRAWLVLGLLVGLLSGGVLTALASARRADTAYGRFLDDTNAWDVAGIIRCDRDAPSTQVGDFVGQQGQVVSGDRRVDPPSPSACLERLRALPSVADLTTINQYGAQFAAIDGHTVQPTADTCYSGPGAVTIAGDPSGRFGTEMNGFKILEGRAADPTSTTEVVVSREAARRLGLRPGDPLDAVLVSYEHCFDDPTDFPEPTRFTVVGITVGSHEVRPASGFFVNFVTTTPAFVETAGTDALDGIVSMVRLRSGHDAPAVDRFLAEVEREGMSMEPQLVQADHAANLQRSIGPSVQGLRILAAVLGLAGLAVLGQLLMRQTALEAAEVHLLRALGASRRQRFTVTASWAVPVAVIAAITAFVVALAGSSWSPIEVARIVEPDPGWSFDLLVHGLGPAIVAPAVLLIAAAPAFRLTGPAAREAQVGGRARPSRVVNALAQASLPPTTVIGVRMALERGRSAVPVRSSFSAIAAGVLVLTATLTFGASLARLVDTPRLIGWNWDNRVSYPGDVGPTGDEWNPVPPAELVAALSAHPGVEAFGLGTIYGPFPGRNLELGDDRVPVDSMSFDSGSGTIGPSITKGRAPSTPYELLLGPLTADQLGVHVGDQIVAYGQDGEWGMPETYADTSVEMLVVGLGVLPVSMRLGTGAATTTDGLRLLAGSNEVELDSVVLRFAPGANPVTVIREVSADLGLPPPPDAALAEDLAFVDAAPLVEVRNIDRLPLLLGVLMALMSLAVLAHVLVSAVMARRGELALLRAIGFDQRQIRRTVAWHAATIALVALVIAVPLGIAVGRAVWLVYAERLGVVPEATVPLGLVWLVPSVLAAAHLVAVVPARMAARGRVAARPRTD